MVEFSSEVLREFIMTKVKEITELNYRNIKNRSISRFKIYFI